jgi:hypothetical protein
MVNIQVSRVAEHEHCNSNISFDAIVIFIVYRSSLTPLSLSLSLSLSGIFGMKRPRRSVGHIEVGRLICNPTPLSSIIQMKND